jgi:hypothetical protein
MRVVRTATTRRTPIEGTDPVQPSVQPRRPTRRHFHHRRQTVLPGQRLAPTPADTGPDLCKAAVSRTSEPAACRHPRSAGRPPDAPAGSLACPSEVGRPLSVAGPSLPSRSLAGTASDGLGRSQRGAHTLPRTASDLVNPYWWSGHCPSRSSRRPGVPSNGRRDLRSPGCTANPCPEPGVAR